MACPARKTSVFKTMHYTTGIPSNAASEIRSALEKIGDDRSTRHLTTAVCVSFVRHGVRIDCNAGADDAGLRELPLHILNPKAAPAKRSRPTELRQ